MILGAAFCPQPPLLVPAVASGAAGELDGVRAACRAAIVRVARPGAQWVLLGPGPVSQAHSPLARGTLAGFGVAGELPLGSPGCGGAVELPPSLTVGAWLLHDALGPRTGAVAYSIGPDFAASRPAAQLLGLAQSQDVVLLVMGDGSARRSTTAPGYLDERAEGFDRSVADALAAGDAVRLDTLDPELGGQLLAAGVPSWRVAGGLLSGGDYEATLFYADAPYGVGYFVAAWTVRA